VDKLSFIELERVSKSFDKGVNFAILDISLSIERGCFLTLLGASGAGKSTLLKFINRLIVPDGGKITIGSNDITRTEVWTLRREVGYVFQGAGLFPHLTVADNIGITPSLLGWKPQIISARVKELLDLVELPLGYATRYPATLSGGERQRVAIARAIAARPAIVLLDEPFGALDPITRDSLATAYRHLHLKFDLTTIMVTHDVQEALLLSDRIVVMNDGRIIADDNPQALMEDSQPKEVRDLMSVPKRQSERIAAIAANRIRF